MSSHGMFGRIAYGAVHGASAARLLGPAVDHRERIDLLDGRSVILSPVRPQDRDAECAFVGSLSLDSRYRRFHFGLRELSPEASRAMTEIDHHHHVAFVARPVLHPRSVADEIVADARYVLRADSADAEFAIALADAWQGAGLGRELLLRLSAYARARGVERLFGDVLWSNSSMITLAKSLGGRLRRTPDDSTVVRAEFSLVDTAKRGGEVAPPAA
jgi:GNAT superfamily N-acetyltransferase